MEAEPNSTSEQSGETHFVIYPLGLMPMTIISAERLERLREASERAEEKQKDTDKNDRPPKPPGRPNAPIGRVAPAGAF